MKFYAYSHLKSDSSSVQLCRFCLYIFYNILFSGIILILSSISFRHFFDVFSAIFYLWDPDPYPSCGSAIWETIIVSMDFFNSARWQPCVIPANLVCGCETEKCVGGFFTHHWNPMKWNPGRYSRHNLGLYARLAFFRNSSVYFMYVPGIIVHIYSTVCQCCESFTKLSYWSHNPLHFDLFVPVWNMKNIGKCSWPRQTQDSQWKMTTFAS